MREIKFRVWNGIEMVYDVTTGKFGTFYVNPDNNGIDRNDSASMTQLNTKYPDGIPLMQYTGLKDKNGVEIYENDLVQILDNEGGSHIYQIKWKPDVYAFVGEGGPGEWLLLEEFEGCELVGNVYENSQT